MVNVMVIAVAFCSVFACGLWREQSSARAGVILIAATAVQGFFFTWTFDRYFHSEAPGYALTSLLPFFVLNGLVFYAASGLRKRNAP